MARFGHLEIGKLAVAIRCTWLQLQELGSFLDLVDADLARLS